MAERAEETGAEESTASPISMDSGLAAVALAAAKRRRRSSQSDAKLDAFLEKQGRLIDLQTEHLHEQRELILSRLRWGRFSDRVKAAIQVMTALVGLAVALAIGAMAWRAHEDHGVTIAAFAVPPDFAQKGLTGQVVASQVLDRLADLEAKTVTARPASTYVNDWGGDIKVEIPETGVSLGELNRYLREWLGHETRISGEVIRTPTGVAVTARVGDAPGKRFDGAEADLDTLVQRAAEAVYSQTQPYRWAVYLASQKQRQAAIAAYRQLAKSGAVEDRAWAYAGLASQAIQDYRGIEAVRFAGDALRLNPRLYPAHFMFNESLDILGRTQAHLEATRRELALHRSGGMVGLTKAESADRQTFLKALEARSLGDYRTASSLSQGLAGASINMEGSAGAYDPVALFADVLARDHDVTGSRRATAEIGEHSFTQRTVLDDWAGLAALADGARGNPALGGVFLGLMARPAGLAYAHLGRFAEAEAVLASAYPTCDDCMIARGQVAALKGDWSAADRWFAEAERRAPSIPIADTAWSGALIDKGDPDAAIAKAAEAHRRGPHFADPLELWGEALARKGDLAGAVAKFAEADKYAPRWGRNHLRWGEALMLSGRYAEARRQYETANGLDLSKPDRASLDVLLARTATGRLHG
jgi:tetratricopeptide (TPR) repeat protein